MEIEPPKFHVSVVLLYYLAQLWKRPLRTPHCYGASDSDRRKFENTQKDSFFQDMGIDPYILRNKTVLDFGCGWGGKAIYYNRFAPKLMFGYDPQLPKNEMVDGVVLLKEKPDYKFDIVLCEDVLEHAQMPDAFFEIDRLLKNGGLLIVKFPSIRSIVAHHFDRAINIPAIHYVWKFKTLASGLNWLREKRGLPFAPFDAVENGRTKNLNGMDLHHFRQLARLFFSELKLECLPYWHFRGEVLSKTIIYVGMK